MNSKPTNVVIAGLGGQGVIKASDILADVARRAGLDVKKSEVHGMSQRGGGVRSDVRFGAAVLSPMVGIAYLSPEPSAPLFVTVGQGVSAGQTLLLIEAMKTFNQIKAPKAGTVTRILVPSGTPVEYGQPLMIIE